MNYKIINDNNVECFGSRRKYDKFTVSDMVCINQTFALRHRKLRRPV